MYGSGAGAGAGDGAGAGRIYLTLPKHVYDVQPLYKDRETLCDWRDSERELVSKSLVGLQLTINGKMPMCLDTCVSHTHTHPPMDAFAFSLCVCFSLRYQT